MTINDSNDNKLPPQDDATSVPTQDASQALRPQTPPNQTPLEQTIEVLMDTPARPKRSHSLRYRNGDLGIRRDEVSHDHERIYVVETESFFSNALPPIPPKVSIDDVMVDVKRDGLLKQGEGVLSWTKFTDASSHENTFFAPLSDIFRSVVASVENRYKLESTQSFVMSPHKSPHTNTNREETFVPDLCFVRRVPGSVTKDGIDWFYVSCPGELKKKDRPNDQNDVSVSRMPHLRLLNSGKEFTESIVWDALRAFYRCLSPLCIWIDAGERHDVDLARISSCFNEVHLQLQACKCLQLLTIMIAY